jgi:hypothetical protein
VAEGKLRVTTNKALVLEYTSKKGKPVSAQIPQGELSADLEQLRRDSRTIQQLDGVEVEFDQEGGAVKRIRRKGQAFVPPSASSTRPQAASGARPMVGTSGSTGRQPQPTPGQTSKTSVQRAFHNPYNFIPAPPRKTNDPDLGDHEPVGHHRLFPDRYTGVIRVKMTAITPLLLPDAANATDIDDGHKSFPVRLDADGKPYIPPTSLKGMLRSAYEAITNSRLAVFPGHEASGSRDATGHGARLAFRRPARSKWYQPVLKNVKKTALSFASFPNSGSSQRQNCLVMNNVLSAMTVGKERAGPLCAILIILSRRMAIMSWYG